uniref:Lipocalin n=1 Tax=Rhipicephalus appendiculatus TaxID=34631 RepID=A0A131YFA7_RHIAP
MRLWLALSALCLRISVSTLTESSDDYDDYDTEEEPTAPANAATRKPLKQVPKTEVYDISKFYTTDEKIWVYKTTKRSNETCTVDDIDHTSPINVFMTRYYFLDGTIKNLTIATNFAVHPQISHMTSTYNEMQIHIPGYGSPFETLMMLGEKNDCGVFYVNYHGYNLPGPDDWFELRLRNSSLEKGPDKKCSKMFNEVTRLQPITFNYSSVCQCIFRLRT